MSAHFIQAVLAGLLMVMSEAPFAQAKLEVTVRNIRAAKGTIRVGLFTTQKDFLKNAADGKIVKASGKEITVVFDLKPGTYAVSVIHDENENEKLDTNMLGIPKEGFAFGNNARGTFGPPSFEDSKVVIEIDDKKQTIMLKYF